MTDPTPVKDEAAQRELMGLLKAHHTGIQAAEVKVANLRRARSNVMHKLHRVHGVSLAKIGAACNGMSAQAVVNNIERFEAQLATEAAEKATAVDQTR